MQTTLDAKKKALELQARREHSREELKKKLLARGFDQKAIAQALDDLASQSWQSDARFAASYVERRSAQGYGPLRLDAELKARGVATNHIQDAVWEGDYPWIEQLAKAWSKKFASTGVAPYPYNAKHIHFLRQRGFTDEHIKHGLKQLAQAGNNT